jgi:thymidylate kinase
MIEFVSEIKKALEALNKYNIEYVIARNYEFLIKGKIYEGKDVDVCISKRSIRRAKKVFRKLGYAEMAINPFSNHLGFGKFIISARKLIFFHIHVGGITGANLMYLNSEHLIENRRKIDYFYVPSCEDELLVVLLHCILDKRAFRKDYRKVLTDLLSKDPDMEYVKHVLTRRIGGTYAKFVLSYLDMGEFDAIEAKAKIMHKYFMDNYPNRLFSLLRVYGFGAIWKGLWLMKNKPLISFIGMDGSGKTTTSNKVIEIIKKNYLRVEYVYGGRGRNNILPIQAIGKGYRKAGGKGSLGKEGKGLKKFSLIHTCAAPVFAFDQFLRYLFKILPSRKKNDFVITDRYSTDILLMNKVPMWLKRILYSVFPRPTMTIYLYNTPEILAKRKGDHPIEDLQRQEKIFRKIGKLAKPIKIKSDGIESTVDKVLEEVFRVFGK